MAESDGAAPDTAAGRPVDTAAGRPVDTAAGRPVDTAAGRPVDTVRRLDGSEATELAALAAVFDDLQYALRCCEHLVGAVARPDPETALIEALWTGALVAYARCFSGRTKILADTDLAVLQLDGDVTGFHRALLRLRDHYASRHANPRETFTVGVAQRTNGTAAGVAVVGAPQPAVDDTTVRQLGRIGYGLSGLVDARMQAAQQKVHLVAQELDAARLAALPLVDVQVPA